MWVGKFSIVGLVALLAWLAPCFAWGEVCPEVVLTDTNSRAFPAQKISQWMYTSAVRIIITKDDGLFRCSGALVKAGKQMEVLTAKHCAQGAQEISVQTANDEEIKVQGIRQHGRWSDFVILELAKQPSHIFAGLKIANQPMQRGETAAMLLPCSLLNAPDKGIGPGLIAKYYGEGSVLLKGPAFHVAEGLDFWPGRSGAPLVNEKGEIVGVGSMRFVVPLGHGGEKFIQAQIVDMPRAIREDLVWSKESKTPMQWSQDDQLTPSGTAAHAKDAIDNGSNIDCAIADLKQVIRELLNCNEKVPPQLYSNLSLGLSKKKSMKEAEYYLNLLAQSLPNLADAQYVVGETAQIGGNKARALEYYGKALVIDPHHRPAKHYLKVLE